MMLFMVYEDGEVEHINGVWPSFLTHSNYFVVISFTVLFFSFFFLEKKILRQSEKTAFQQSPKIIQCKIKTK